MLWELYTAALLAFPNLHIASAVTVLAAATPGAAAQLSEDDLRRLLHAARYPAPRDLLGKLHRIFTSPQLRQSPAVERPWGRSSPRSCGPWPRP